jgi:hypothetical protein
MDLRRPAPRDKALLARAKSYSPAGRNCFVIVNSEGPCPVRTGSSGPGLVTSRRPSPRACNAKGLGRPGPYGLGVSQREAAV